MEYSPNKADKTIYKGDCWTVTFEDIYFSCGDNSEYCIDFFDRISRNRIFQKNYVRLSFQGDIVTLYTARRNKEPKRHKKTYKITDNISVLKNKIPLELLLVFASLNIKKNL